MKRFLLPIVLLLICVIAKAQEQYWMKPDSVFKFVQPVASVQLWGTYSMGEKAQQQANGPLLPVDDRASFMLRRARFGFKGKPYPRLSYMLTVHYDNLGKDKFSAVRGGTNTGTLGILDAYVSWKFTNNDVLHMTAGYLQPQISRECITGDILVNSLDKSPSQSYIRQHITGKGYGRTTGVNLGGMLGSDEVTFTYNGGVFNNNSTGEKNLAETSGYHWSPLTIGRVALTVGDREMKSYSINYDANNYYCNRKGVTFGAYSSYQGQTDIFSSNTALGFDMLLNYGSLNLDGEWTFMERVTTAGSYKSQTGHARLGYNIIVANKYFLEPTLMAMKFQGDAGGQFSGIDRMYDVGVNWYLNKKNCKLSAHYIWQEGWGDNGVTDEVTFQKGNFAALALVLLM